MTKASRPKNIVFYADDDTDDLELVKDAFAHFSNNVKVVTAKNGIQACAYLDSLNEKHPLPCLIILDINMPLLNGKEVLKKIRANPRFKSIPVVLFTTSSLPQDHEFAKKYHAGYVTKPLDVAQMQVITELFIDHCAEEIKKNIRRHLQ